MKAIKFLSLGVALILITACNQHQPKNYLPLMQEIHQIECENLKKSGVVIADTNAFDFRSKAFKYILEDLDRKALAHYEELCNHIATMESYMDADEKSQFDKDLENEYQNGCKLCLSF